MLPKLAQVDDSLTSQSSLRHTCNDLETTCSTLKGFTSQAIRTCLSASSFQIILGSGMQMRLLINLSRTSCLTPESQECTDATQATVTGIVAHSPELGRTEALGRLPQFVLNLCVGSADSQPIFSSTFSPIFPFTTAGAGPSRSALTFGANDEVASPVRQLILAPVG